MPPKTPQQYHLDDPDGHDALDEKTVATAFVALAKDWNVSQWEGVDIEKALNLAVGTDKDSAKRRKTLETQIKKWQQSTAWQAMGENNFQASNEVFEYLRRLEENWRQTFAINNMDDPEKFLLEAAVGFAQIDLDHPGVRWAVGGMMEKDKQKQIFHILVRQASSEPKNIQKIDWVFEVMVKTQQDLIDVLNEAVQWRSVTLIDRLWKIKLPKATGVAGVHAPRDPSGRQLQNNLTGLSFEKTPHEDAEILKAIVFHPKASKMFLNVDEILRSVLQKAPTSKMSLPFFEQTLGVYLEQGKAGKKIDISRLIGSLIEHERVDLLKSCLSHPKMDKSDVETLGVAVLSESANTTMKTVAAEFLGQEQLLAAFEKNIRKYSLTENAALAAANSLAQYLPKEQVAKMTTDAFWTSIRASAPIIAAAISSVEIGRAVKKAENDKQEPAHKKRKI